MDSEGTIVIAEDELSKVFVYDNVIKYLNPFKWAKYFAKKSIQATAWGIGKAWDGLKALGRGAATVGSLALRGGLRLLGVRMGPQDVIVNGEDDAALTGIKMKAGEYRSKTTGAIIHSPNDIDGPVIDSTGQTILDAKDIATGLHIVGGKAVKTKTGIFSKIGKGLSAIGSLIYRGTSLKKSLPGLKNRVKPGDKTPAAPSNEAKPAATQTTATAAIAKVADTVKPVTMAEQAQVKATTLLQELVDHFKGKDTPRMGSYVEELQEKKEAEDKAKPSGVLGIPSITGKKKAEDESLTVAKKTEGVEEESLDTLKTIKDLLEVQAAEGAVGAIPGGGGGKAAGKVGSRLGSIAKGAVKWGARGLGAAGAAYGAYSAYKNLKAGNYGEAALDAGGSALGIGGMIGAGSLATAAGAAGTAAMGGLAATGTAIAGAATAVGGGLLAFVTSPVVLAVGATALAGYGLYKGYKYLQTKTLDVFTKLRYTQYGIDTGNSGAVNKIFSLEEYLSDKLSVDSKSVAIDPKKLDRAKLFATFDIDPNGKQASRFGSWFENRFKAVYLTHMTAINAIANKADFSEISSLKKDGKQKFLDAVKFTDGPYNYNDVPISGVKATTSTDVQAAITLCQEDIGKPEKKKDSAMSRALTVAGIADASAAEAAELAKRNLAAPTLTADSTKQSPTVAAQVGGGRGVSQNSAYVPMAPDAAPTAEDKVAGLREQSRGLNAGTTRAGLPADPSAKVPDAGPGGGIESYRDTITGAAKMVGVDPNHLLATAAVESDFRNNAVPGTSSAQGLFQFISGTWSDMVNKYGKKYGIVPGTPATDPKAASIMGAQFLKDNLAAISGSTKRAIGVTEGYLAHFLGAGNANSFLKGLDSNPNAPAASQPGMEKSAASNASIFYENGRPRSFSEIYNVLDSRLRSKARKYGIALGENAGAVAGARPGVETVPAVMGSADGVAPIGANKRNVVATPAAMASGAGSTDVVVPGPNKRNTGNAVATNGPTDASMGPPVSAAGVSDNTMGPPVSAAGNSDTTMGPPVSARGPTDGPYAVRNVPGPAMPNAGSVDPKATGRLRGRQYAGNDAATPPTVNGPMPAPYAAPTTGPQPAMANVYGMATPMQTPMMTPRSTGGFDKSLLLNTESILSQQLDIQKQILAVLSKVGIGTVSSAAPVPAPATQSAAADATATPNRLDYATPVAPISMRRITRYN